MDFYGKLGDLLSEALEKGEIPKDDDRRTLRNYTETNKTDGKSAAAQKDAEPGFGKARKAERASIAGEENESPENENQNTTRIDSRDREKARTFTFTQFGQSKAGDEKPKRTFSFEQFAKMNQEAAHTEPKVQIYKFSQLVIPQNVLYALNVIGIPTNADFELAKKIYREKIMYYHPDKWLNTPYIELAKTNTQTLNMAWEIVEWWYVAR
jgi:hypothetical protein